MTWQHINNTWTTVSRYVDIETGEELTKYIVENQYRITKKIKNVKTKANGHKYVEILNECKRRESQQLSINF